MYQRASLLPHEYLGPEVRNPSDYTVTLEDLEYRVYVEDVEVVARSIDELTLQPNATVEAPLEAKVILEAPIRLFNTIKTPTSLTLIYKPITAHNLVPYQIKMEAIS